MLRPGGRRPEAGAAKILAICLALGAFTAVGQTCTTLKLRVLVHDPSGGPVSGAEVRIARDSSNAATRSTNEQGVAEFESLACGSWYVTAVKEGFHELRGTAFQITGGTNAELDLTLTSLVVHESVDVHDRAASVQQNSSQVQPLQPNDVKNLPARPVTVSDTLPLVPGVTRTLDGEIKIDGTGEHRSAFVVNSADVTDPATGKFGQTIPIDSAVSIEVLNTPFLAEYGNFTSGVVAVETRRGGDSWHAELNDPLPGFRFRSWHMRGIRDSTPRSVWGGPLIPHRLYYITALQYSLVKKPERTLPFPFNESKQESVNSLTQLDYILSPRQLITGSFHFSPQHVNFVNPEYFNPQPVTPNYAQHNYVATVGDHFAIGGGMLDSTFSIQSFDAMVGSQGNADMILTPVGNRGDYFSWQKRDAARAQWLEIWSPAQLDGAGKHDLKLGASATLLSNNGEMSARTINVLGLNQALLRRIEFTGGRPYRLSDSELAAFAQDHWSLNSKLSLDAGARIERQDVAGSVRLAPRTGLSWTPFSSGQTVLHGGYGIFYDRVPLSVYTFAANPQRVITSYASDGSVIGEPITTPSVIGSVSAATSLLIHNRQAPGNFTPRSAIWNAQIEQRISRLFRIRAVYTHSRSAGLVVLEPDVVESSQLLLRGSGRSRDQQAEVTGRFEWKNGQQLFLSYTRSRTRGHLNDFSSFVGNFPTPLIRQDVYSNLPGDLPNRFLAWGRVNLPYGLQFLPVLEYRNGFRYARVDALGDYVGMPFGDRTRFPNFFSADARILKDVKVNPKYTLRFSVSGFNLTNHFNALNVHANTADPEYGVFFGNYHLRYRADFDVLF